MACGSMPATAQTFPSSAGNLSVETIASGLTNPWALAFLPDGRMLVTERPGRLRIVGRDGKLSPAVAGVPAVRASGQGGLHDVALDRQFAGNKTIYFCFAEPASGGGRTGMARAKLNDGEAPRLDDVKVIFRQEGPLSGGNHFGCRIVQGRDGNLWLTMGDHFTYRDEAQNLADEVLEEIRMLTNLETFTEKLLQIVLVGQTELEQKLKQPHLRQLRQRLTLRAKTHALAAEETKAYIQQRLRIAGSNGQPIFDGDAFTAIHRYSNGIPRVVNLICEHCLVSAFVDQQKTVGPTIVDAVARDFDLGDNPATLPPPPLASADKFDLTEALKTLSNLAERLKDPERELPKEGKL